MRRRTLNLFAMAIGSAPGFLVPIAIIATQSVVSSDLILLGVSVALVVSTISGSALEASYTALAVRAHTHDGGIGPQGLRSSLRFTFLFGSVFSVAIFPLVCSIYGVVSGSGLELTRDLLTVLWPLAIGPVFACGSSPAVGVLVASDSVPAVLLSQAFRGVPAILAAIFVRDLTVLAIIFTAGEAVRFGFLTILSRSRVAIGGRPLGRPTVLALLLQMGSMSISQLLPIFVRSALVGGPIGSLSAGDFAMRIYSGANQVVSSVVVLPAISGLAFRIRNRPPNVRYREVVLSAMIRTGLAGALVAGVVSVGVGLALLLSRFFSFDSLFSLGLQWALVLLVALPFLAANVFGSRIMLMHEVAWPFPLVAITALMVAVVTRLLIPFPVGAILGLTLGQTVAGAIVAGIAVRTARGGEPTNG